MLARSHTHPFARRRGRESLLGAGGVVALLAVGLAAPLLYMGRHVVWLPTVGLLVLAVAGAVGVCRYLWPDQSATQGVAAIVVGLALAYVAFVGGALGAYILDISQGLCGVTPYDDALPVVGVTAYALVAGWSFRSPGRLMLGWPLAVLIGFAAMLALHAALPGAHGYCET
jgi:hypothetical protein